MQGQASDIPAKLRQDLKPTMIANWKVWVPFQFINFRFVPQSLQARPAPRAACPAASPVCARCLAPDAAALGSACRVQGRCTAVCIMALCSSATVLRAGWPSLGHAALRAAVLPVKLPACFTVCLIALSSQCSPSDLAIRHPAPIYAAVVHQRTACLRTPCTSP